MPRRQVQRLARRRSDAGRESSDHGQQHPPPFGRSPVTVACILCRTTRLHGTRQPGDIPSTTLPCLVLPYYCQLREALCELLYTRIGDLGLGQVQLLQLGQTFEVLQAHVRNLRA